MSFVVNWHDFTSQMLAANSSEYADVASVKEMKKGSSIEATI